MHNNKIILTKYLTLKYETKSDFSDWFGYYNYDTLNINQQKLLSNRANFDGVAPEKGMTIELGYYNLPNGIWCHIANSDSWNWQQGAMMQWIPGDDNRDKIIYNTSKENRLISQIYDINTQTTNDIDWPIYGITPDGKKSISIELERSRWCRAYHYKSVENPNMDGRVVEGDGIFEIDLINNTRKRIISIQNIINTDYRSYFENCKHWLEHIMISPSGNKFCFLHRFSPESNVFKYETRLCVANIDGSNLQVIPNWDKYRWSHFGWKSDDEFAIYTVESGKLVSSYAKQISNTKKTAKKSLKQNIMGLLVSLVRFVPKDVRKKLKGNNDYYQYYRLNDNKFEHIGDWKQSFFDIDGHPSFTHDGRYMITDSYPDKKGYQRLIVFDTQTKKGIIVGKFFANYKGNPASCDLHPKLCRNNDYLVVDTAYDEKHHMVMFKLNWDEIKKKISR